MSRRDTTDEILLWESFNPQRITRRDVRAKRRFSEENFRCRHCGSWVHTDMRFSGVQNRNHCPYCLWSLHVDLSHAGDRLCACRGAMQPIGLTLKSRNKKYGSAQGEVMLAHQCTQCSTVVINRIAADDDHSLLTEIYRQSLTLEEAEFERLQRMGVCLLAAQDAPLLQAQLVGRRGNV